MINSEPCGSTDDSRRSGPGVSRACRPATTRRTRSLVETTHYTFDVTGFDDYNGIPSSQQKRVLERYWREGDNLKVTVTVEDPLFLREPASYTTQWIPAPAGYKLRQYDCDPVEARHPVRFLIPRYK